MSSSDPMIFAVRASGMSDAEINEAFHAIQIDDGLDDYRQAILDEARFRGLLSASEADTISTQAGRPFSG